MGSGEMSEIPNINAVIDKSNIKTLIYENYTNFAPDYMSFLSGGSQALIKLLTMQINISFWVTFSEKLFHSITITS